MRITYLHQYFTSPAGSSGTRSYEFARRLNDWGHEVQIITSSANLPLTFKSNEPISHMEIDGIQVTVIDVPYSNSMNFAERINAFTRFALLASREVLRFPTDLIFATSTPLTIAIPAIIGKFWHRIPMVFEIRDLWPELPIAIGALRSPISRFLAKVLEWAAYYLSDHIVVLSPGMADGVMRCGINKKRITIIPNSCDLQRFNVPADRGLCIRKNLGLNEDQPLILYAGTFGKLNGVGYLVDLAAEMKAIFPEVRFLLVGEGAERDLVLAKAYDKEVLGNNVHIWKPRPKEQMPEIFAAATIVSSLFIPLEAMWHNSANKFFDGLAAGKPIMINHGGWQAELLQQSGAGIVLSPNDPRDAAKQLVAFLKDEQRLSKARIASQKLAHERFDRDILAKELETVLNNVVNNSGGLYEHLHRETLP